jgi:hypothetical protein
MIAQILRHIYYRTGSKTFQLAFHHTQFITFNVEELLAYHWWYVWHSLRNLALVQKSV